MRLIDADALFINLDGMMAVSPTGYIHGDTVADMISDAPTVEAIPIEWIKEYIDLQESYDTEWGDISGVTIRELLRYCGERKEECGHQ